MHNLNKFWREWRGFLIFMILLVGFRSAVGDWYEVPTGSMKPTIVEGDRIYVNRLAYGFKVPFTSVSLAQWDQPKRGDIVVFNSRAAGKRLVKRVIGIPGDTVLLQHNRLYLNGSPATYRLLPRLRSGDTIWHSQVRSRRILDETLAGETHLIATLSPDATFGPVTVPQGKYFVLGDNRDNSADSRYIGFVPASEIVGKADAVVMSLDSDDYYLPRADRFLKTLR